MLASTRKNDGGRPLTTEFRTIRSSTPKPARSWMKESARRMRNPPKATLKEAPCLHPPDAELGRREMLVQRCGDAQRERVARLHRVTDPTVPQPRRGIVRVALVLVKLNGGALEFRLFLRRHLRLALA